MGPVNFEQEWDEPVKAADYLLPEAEIPMSFFDTRMCRLEEQAWQAATRLILRPREEDSAATISYALRSFAGKISPAHPALKLLEEHLGHLRGERKPLTTAELRELREHSRGSGIGQ